MFVKGQSGNPSGRPKGVPSKATLAKQARFAALGGTPLGYMMKVMNDPNEPPARRDAMAIAAAPFVHPKLAQITHQGDLGVQLTVIERRVIKPEDGPVRLVAS